MPNNSHPTASKDGKTDLPRAGIVAPRSGRLAALLGMRRKFSTGDVVMAAIGVSLAVVSAVFPWYIFYNPDQFGIRALQFQGNQSDAVPSSLSRQPSRIGKPMTIHDKPTMGVDLIATATLTGQAGEVDAVELADQPFPPDLIEYRLIHVANGRAMIEDEDGIWIVQKGSRLPDSSRVASIEERDGGWVLTTTLDRVVELTR
jgi:hypothetical protein